MSGYTPTMQRIGDMYTWAYAWRTEDGTKDNGEPETDLSGLRAQQRGEFNRALAQHEAELRQQTLAPIVEFLATVHGLNEMNVVRGLRKVMAGEHSTFEHEVRLSVYGAPCGHAVPAHYPEGYGKCDDCVERGATP